MIEDKCYYKNLMGDGTLWHHIYYGGGDDRRSHTITVAVINPFILCSEFESRVSFIFKSSSTANDQQQSSSVGEKRTSQLGHLSLVKNVCIPLAFLL